MQLVTLEDIIEPMIYRAVIDDVIQAVKPEFDDYGVAEDVLSDLQSVRPAVLR